MKTFDGLQSMLAIFTVAMFMIYREIKAIHFNLLLDAGYNHLDKDNQRELINFIYYNISKVVSILLMPVKSRWEIQNTEPEQCPGQINLLFN